MKKKLFFIFFYFFFTLTLYASENVYESEFYTVNITNNKISDAKINEIEKVKLLTFNKIINQILTDKDLKRFKRIYNIEDEIHYLIKNIIIEDEFISLKTYSAKIKVNFNINLIINMLRDSKINYTDIESPNILLIISEKNDLYQQALTFDNNFYEKIKSKKFGLLNLVYPKLSPNDQYILPYKKIIMHDLSAFKKIANKYDVNFIFILNLFNRDDSNYFELTFFDNTNNNFKKIGRIKNYKENNFEVYLFNFINNWWKEYNLINNSIINEYFCFVNSSNINYVHQIYSKINTLSQIKSMTLTKIELGSNLYNIIFYGDLSNLTLKLFNSKISLKIESDKKCIISIFN